MKKILKIEQHVNREYLKYVVRMRNTQFSVRATDNLNHTMFAQLVHALFKSIVGLHVILKQKCVLDNKWILNVIIMNKYQNRYYQYMIKY